MYQIKFGTDGWRAIIGAGYTIDNLTRVATATAKWLLTQKASPSVMIGYDCRFNGELFCRHVANVMAQQGIKVFISDGFASTPMVSLAVHKRQIDAGIVLTASHNPPTYSGFKLKGSYGGPLTPSQISAVEALIPSTAEVYTDRFTELAQEGKIEYYDMEAVYLNHIKANFDLKAIQAAGFKIAYDAMFGAGQRAFRKLFPNARHLHSEFNPSFKGTAPEPIERNLGELQDVLRKGNFDVGFATDGDADRIGVFDNAGNFVDSHHVILLLIKYLHSKKGMAGKVVTTFSVTPKVKKLCDKLGLPLEITPIGFKYICDIMLKENVLVGGEESGGIAIAGHIPERDGIYIAITLLEMMALSKKSLSELIEEIYQEVGQFTFERRDLHLPNTQKEAVIEACKKGEYDRFGAYQVVQTEDLDGYKFHFENDAWALIRPSGTEPVLRLYAEANTGAEAEKILDAVEKTVI